MLTRTTRSWCTLGSLAALQMLVGCMQGNAEDDSDQRSFEPAAQMAHADGGKHGGMQHGGMQHGGVDAGKPSMHDAGGMTGHDGMDMSDGGMHGTGEMGDAPCPPNFPRISPAVTKVGDLTIKVVALSPRPPRQKVFNDWELEITDATGAPVVGAQLTNTNSWMEVHRHPGDRQPVVQPLAAPGHYKLDNIDFTMRGPWEVQFDLQAPGGKLLPVAIKACVE
jgi:hypothetical protein